jgi:hypothetical protein
MARITHALIVAVLACFATAAAAAADSGGPLLRLPFRQLTYPYTPGQGVPEATSVRVDGRYTFLSDNGDGGDGGTLIDERSGTRIQVSRAGCRPAALGGPWLAFDCGAAAIQLYSLAGHAWTPVTLAPGLAEGCVPPPDFDGQPCRVVDVGRSWIKLAYSVCERQCADPPAYLFVNVATGAVGADPSATTTLANLDSPALAQPVCAPLTVPPGAGANGEPQDLGQLGPLVFAGRYALATTPAQIGFAATYRERCGSHLHQLLCRECAVTANARVALWIGNGCTPAAASRPRLAGIVLASGHRFQVRPPITPTCFAPFPTRPPAVLAFVKLSSRTVYVGYDDQAGGLRVFAAPAPR